MIWYLAGKRNKMEDTIIAQMLTIFVMLILIFAVAFTLLGWIMPDVVYVYKENITYVEKQQPKFLELAEVWWWESNRLVPINVFLKQDWANFRGCLKTFNSKDVNIEHGPYISLKEIASKRSKRRSITLVRKVN